MTTPITDPRPFAPVLADWLTRHGLTRYAASRDVLSASDQTIGKWLAGAPCPYQREVRALMTLHDEGRAVVGTETKERKAL